MGDCKQKDCGLRVERGIETMDDLAKKLMILPTGSEDLDEVIDSGIFTGEVTEIAGPSSSGKTQLCYSLISVALLYSPGSICVYLDTNESFRVSRLVEILRARYPPITADNIRALLTRVYAAPVENHVDLMHTLNLIEELAKRKNVRLLVLDSAAMALGYTGGVNTPAAIRDAGNVCQKLRLLSARYELAVVATNHADFALGQWWAGLPATRIFCKRTEAPGRVQFERCRKFSQKGSGEFVLSEKGVDNIPGSPIKERVRHFVETPDKVRQNDEAELLAPSPIL